MAESTRTNQIDQIKFLIGFVVVAGLIVIASEVSVGALHRTPPAVVEAHAGSGTISLNMPSRNTAKMQDDASFYKLSADVVLTGADKAQVEPDNGTTDVHIEHDIDTLIGGGHAVIIQNPGLGGNATGGLDSQNDTSIFPDTQGHTAAAESPPAGQGSDMLRAAVESPPAGQGSEMLAAVDPLPAVQGSGMLAAVEPPPAGQGSDMLAAVEPLPAVQGSDMLRIQEAV